MKKPHRLAVPVLDGRFCPHFGRAEGFLLGDADLEANTICSLRTVEKPIKPGQCESVPQWLRSLAVDRVLAGGMGMVARQSLNAAGMEVVTGLSGEDPAAVMRHWLTQRPVSDDAPCRAEDHVQRHCRRSFKTE
ncbi:MAG: hypothetical protein IT440_03455 [Phycisphaeraceae bacterium]|nr:hypothetical protein [Phycisphaeraceae bacterium]